MPHVGPASDQHHHVLGLVLLQGEEIRTQWTLTSLAQIARHLPSRIAPPGVADQEEVSSSLQSMSESGFGQRTGSESQLGADPKPGAVLKSRSDELVLAPSELMQGCVLPGRNLVMRVRWGSEGNLEGSASPQSCGRRASGPVEQLPGPLAAGSSRQSCRGGCLAEEWNGERHSGIPRERWEILSKAQV